MTNFDHARTVDIILRRINKNSCVVESHFNKTQYRHSENYEHFNYTFRLYVFLYLRIFSTTRITKKPTI